MTDKPDWMKNFTPAPPGRWTEGQSGNPRGRPRGSQNRRTQVQQALDDAGSAIAQVVIDAAKGGDLQACALVLARIAPPPRPRGQRVTFELDTRAPLTEQARSVLAAIARGEVDPETGKLIIDSIASLGNLMLTDELAARVEAIEALRGHQSSSGSKGGVLCV